MFIDFDHSSAAGAGSKSFVPLRFQAILLQRLTLLLVVGNPVKEVIMFAGHVGAAMAIARVERRVNLGAFVFAAVLLDFVLWSLVLLGWESVTIPADFDTTHQPTYVFPYSHGLLASLGWSVLAGAVTFLWYPRLNRARLRAAALVFTAVFSHWLLDALVHAPELPVAGARSAKVGLWLWQSMPLALAIEAFVALTGLYLFVSRASLSRTKKFWLSVVSLLIVGFTVLGMTVAPRPPSVVAMAASSLVTIIAVSALSGWLGRLPHQTGA